MFNNYILGALTIRLGQAVPQQRHPACSADGVFAIFGANFYNRTRTGRFALSLKFPHGADDLNGIVCDQLLGCLS